MKSIQLLALFFIHVFLLQIPPLNIQLLLWITFLTLLPNLLFTIRFVIDIIFSIIVVLPLLSQVLTLLFYATTLNLFLRTLSLTRKTLQLRELTLLFLNVLLFLLIITLVTFSLVPPLRIPLFFHLIVIYLTLILL